MLLGVGEGDDEATADALADKVRALRVFDDADGADERSARRSRGALRQPVHALRRDGEGQPAELRRRPRAPELAEPLYERFCERLGASAGDFGARMEVELVNDGPVTLILER